MSGGKETRLAPPLMSVDDTSGGGFSTALSLAAGSLVTTHRVAALIISPGLPPGVTSGGINHLT